MVEPTAVGIISTFRALVQGVQAINDLAVSVEVKAQVTKLYDVIITGQQIALKDNLKQRAMLDTIGDLKEQIANMKAWEEQKKRYKLTNPWGNAAVVYALKESRKETENPHWICTKCYDDGRRTILQERLEKSGWVLMCCPTCKSEVHTGYRGIGPAEYVAD
jgi:hypothetical protein